MSSELSSAGTEYTVLANTAESGRPRSIDPTTHPVGSKVRVKGRSHPAEPAFIEIRNVPPAEVIVLLRNPF